MASNFAIVTTMQETKILAYDSTIVHMTYLTLHVPSTETCLKMKMIEFECESRDQDLESYSYSWGDLVVKSSSGVELYRQKRAYENAVADSNYWMHIQLHNENDEIVQKMYTRKHSRAGSMCSVQSLDKLCQIWSNCYLLLKNHCGKQLSCT